MNIELLTVEEAAERLKVSSYTVREWLKQGKIRGMKIGGTQWRISVLDLDAFITRGNIPKQERPATRTVHKSAVSGKFITGKDMRAGSSKHADISEVISRPTGRSRRVVTDTMLLSETALAHDWLRPEEDEAWADL